MNDLVTATLHSLPELRQARKVIGDYRRQSETIPRLTSTSVSHHHLCSIINDATTFKLLFLALTKSTKYLYCLVETPLTMFPDDSSKSLVVKSASFHLGMFSL